MDMTREVPPLYEAMNLGRHLLSACSGGGVGGGRGCAIDMAMAAVGDMRVWTYAYKHWGWLQNLVPSVFSEQLVPLSVAIGTTFDTHVMMLGDWSMDAFIDYVKEIELRETAPVLVTAEGEGIKVPMMAEVHQ
jgi:hypothetical protein